MRSYLLAVLTGLILLAGCAKSISQSTPQSLPTGQPEWVIKLIDKYMSEPVGNPPQSIWRYEYQGQIVYYIPAQCCDMYSTLYDQSGNIICAPDGGIDGKGDGKCPDFSSQKTGEHLIWKDSR